MVTYQPKGGMCGSCMKIGRRDCMDLPFSEMPVIKKDGEVIIVKCFAYIRREK